MSDYMEIATLRKCVSVDELDIFHSIHCDGDLPLAHLYLSLKMYHNKESSIFYYFKHFLFNYSNYELI